MLHTINDAWVSIIVRQLQSGIIGSALLVAKDIDEVFKIVGYAEKLLGSNFENYKLPPFSIYTEDVIYRNMYPDIANIGGIPVFDDVLISHEIHDPMIKSYLAQHCRRKGA